MLFHPLLSTHALTRVGIGVGYGVGYGVGFGVGYGVGCSVDKLVGQVHFNLRTSKPCEQLQATGHAWYADRGSSGVPWSLQYAVLAA